MRTHVLDADELRAASRGRLLVGVGRTSRENLAGRCARALARFLGVESIEFPGGHNGFLMHPRAFATQLHAALASEVRESSRHLRSRQRSGS